VLTQRISPDAISLRKNVLLRYKGTDTAIPVDFTGDVRGMTAAFEALYHSRFGFVSDGKSLVVETAAVEAVGDTGNARRSVGGASTRWRQVGGLSYLPFVVR
jgi:5-oxoprolinase (ATP-hydrolysing)